MYDPTVGRFTVVDPLAHKYFPVSPYSYVANMPIRAIDPDGKRIIIVNNSNTQQVIQDLGKIYATKRGKQLIDRLASSMTDYYIDGSASTIKGGFIGYPPLGIPWGTRYYGLTKTIKYTQKSTYVEGAYSPSYITLGHELYHAYQDEANAKYNYSKGKEAAAMKFENYLRDVLEQGQHRTKHSGSVHLSSVTAFNSNGERVDVNSVNVETIISGGTDNSESEDGSTRGNVNNGTSISATMENILTYMDKNGINKLVLKFDQREE